MKTKKIRGHRRIWRNIEQWKKANLILDIEKMTTRETHERHHAKINVKPFYVHPNFINSSSDILIDGYQNPQPKGKTKKYILQALFDIYENWKIQLERTEQPYYLKIWLFKPNFHQSQVVCALGKSIDFYEYHFTNPKKIKEFKANYTGMLKTRIENFNWQHKINEQFLDNTGVGVIEDFESEEDYQAAKKWFKSRLKKTHRIEILEKPIGDVIEYYVFNIGNVWIGEKQK
ncbi:hypothetical protein [Aquimarina algiphila]|uniref:hypothetical protein n=1 Tax=Aquimarina algiphila TaxID=2047982 RepID=UPI00232C6D44|nr:hypothetical protein [Aquimarina algiphila]